MKIISKHSDYYDGCNYDHSPASGVFVRHTESIDIDNWIGLRNSVISNLNEGFDMTTGLIGFCGELYPFVRWHDEKTEKVDYIYSYEDFLKVRKIGLKREKIRSKWFGRYELLSSKPDMAKRWFNTEFQTLYDGVFWGSYMQDSNKKIINPYDLFLEHKVPYFALHSHIHGGNHTSNNYELVLNPPLQDYMFYRIFDSYTAFQEIEMYLNNVLVKPDDPHIDPVPDKIKAESHGFDKFSFRKDKTKKDS